MKIKLEKLDGLKFQELSKDELRSITGGDAGSGTSQPCGSYSESTTYILPTTDIWVSTDSGGDCYWA